MMTITLSRRAAITGGAAMALLARRATAQTCDLAAAIDRAALAAIAAGACPGVQVAIRGPRGMILSRGYGLADIARKTPVTAHSVFRIGSLSKQFTAAAIFRLAAAGRLDPDAPVATYLRSLRSLPPLSLRELIHHTAGLHSDESESAPPPGTAPVRSQIALAAEIARQKTPFDFAPGTAWLYSNANYIVLGAVIEAVTRMPFATALARLIFAPLGLGHTAVDHAADAVRDRATGYSAAAGKPGGFEPAAALEVSDAGGAGALRSTAPDLCRWHAGLLGGRLLDRAHLAQMLAPGTLRDGRLSGANRFSAGDAHYGATQYAGGLLVSPPAEPHRSILHYGAINGFAAVLQTWLDAGITLAVLTNGDIGPATPFRAMRQAVLASLPG